MDIIKLLMILRYFNRFRTKRINGSCCSQCRELSFRGVEADTLPAIRARDGQITVDDMTEEHLQSQMVAYLVLCCQHLINPPQSGNSGNAQYY
jgi:hypothetical protein